ncbi:MAG: pantetheine-phosphate adenylyltransferase [Deltaproteobacteria bacterium]|nr:MAG: pantetheine-phosphate adenylyltransferase [Deltaproteobacteria bacterium]
MGALKKKKIAVYPGSFDPVTNGHCDIVWRGLRLFDGVIVAVARNGSKNPLFTVEERLEMLRETFKDTPGVEVDSFDGLLVNYVANRGADAILRGLRAVSDFEYEFQMALMNRKLNKNIQTVFLMTGLRWIFISSSIIKEAAQFGGQTRGMVPDIVCEKLKEKFSKSSSGV